MPKLATTLVTHVMGLIVALAIGVAVVGGNVLCAQQLGRYSDLSEEQGPLIFQVLWVAAPFMALTLAGKRSVRAWGTGLVVTAAFWALLLLAVYLGRPGDANIGMAALMFISPLIICAAAFWAGRTRA